MMDPDPAWANPRDCGNFPCTAPLNALLSFKDNTFTGENEPEFAANNFQVIANNPGFAPYV